MNCPSRKRHNCRKVAELWNALNHGTLTAEEAVALAPIEGHFPVISIKLAAYRRRLVHFWLSVNWMRARVCSGECWRGWVMPLSCCCHEIYTWSDCQPVRRTRKLLVTQLMRTRPFVGFCMECCTFCLEFFWVGSQYKLRVHGARLEWK